MRIVVDLNRCQGYAQCVPLAPEVLKLKGEEALAYDPNPDDSQRHCQLEVVWTFLTHISLIRHTRPGESRRRNGENRPRIAQVDSAIRRGWGGSTCAVTPTPFPTITARPGGVFLTCVLSVFSAQ